MRLVPAAEGEAVPSDVGSTPGSCTIFLYGAFFGGAAQMAVAATTITAQQTAAQIVTLLALNFVAGFGLILAVELIIFILAVMCGCCCGLAHDMLAASDQTAPAASAPQ